MTLLTLQELNMQNLNSSMYDWHMYLERGLQQSTVIVAAKKGIEIRKYVSDALREKLQKDAVLVGSEL